MVRREEEQRRKRRKILGEGKFGPLRRKKTETKVKEDIWRRKIFASIRGEEREEERRKKRRTIFREGNIWSEKESRTEKGKEENILEKERDDAQIYVPMV